MYRATGEILLPASFDDGGEFQGPIREVSASIPGFVAFSLVLHLGIGTMSAGDCITVPLERDQDTSRCPKDECWCFRVLHDAHAN
jgi:hypothetical protein